MKTLLTTAIAVLLLLAVASAAWAGGHDGRHDRGHHRREARPPVDVGPDRNGDGKVTNLERINYARQQRFERLHGR